LVAALRQKTEVFNQTDTVGAIAEKRDRTPRIGRRPVAVEAPPMDADVAPLTSEEIVERADAEPSDFLAAIAPFTKAYTDATRAADRENRATAQDTLRPLIEEGESLLARFDALKAEHAEHVGALTAIDWSRLVPLRDNNGHLLREALVPLRLDGPISNHEKIGLLARLVGELALNLQAQPPEDMVKMIATAKTLSGDHIDFANTNAERYLRTYNARARNQVEGVEALVRQVTIWEAKVAEDLKLAGPLPVAEPRIERLTMEEDSPQRGGSSFANFDPRDYMDPKPSDNEPEVVFVGKNRQGVRIGNLVDMPERGKGKVV